MGCHHRSWFLLLAVAGCLVPGRARAQAPTIDSGLPGSPGGMRSALGSPPGTNSSALGAPPGAGASPFGDSGGGGFLGGRPGTSTPRVPSSVSNPTGAGVPALDQQGITAPREQPTPPVQLYGSLELVETDDAGPRTGLTLDQAIDRAVRENIDLRSKFYEIPQAQADILNAGLRSNPVFYADGQLIPYGKFNRSSPGGPTQYDVNISYPLDVSHKRQARVEYASRAKRSIEALYQDAVRMRIDDVYGAFVDVLAARQTLRYVRKSVEGLTKLYEVTEQLYKKDMINRADVSRVKIQVDQAKVGALDAEEQYRSKKRALAGWLNLPPDDADALEVRGTILVAAPEAPSKDELVRAALGVRPDVVATRMGVSIAESNVRLQKANAFSDIYVLAQPYTFQNNQPYGLKSPVSWALGVTVPLPVYNRNQGGIERAKLNVTQSQIEVGRIERQVVTDVQQAIYEYEVTKKMVQRIRDVVIPQSKQVRDDTYRLYKGGEVNLVVYLNAQKEYNDSVKQYLDTVVRHRRSMLALNTVLGQRMFP